MGNSAGLSVTAGETQMESHMGLRQVYMQINGGAPFTNHPQVTLDLGAPNAASVRLSQTLGEGTAVPYAAQRSFTLSEQGDNTVYATFYDGENNEISTVNAHIFLDSQAEILSFTEDSGAQGLDRGDVIHFRMETGEQGGAAHVNIVGYQDEILLRDDGLRGDVTADDGIYEIDFYITSAQDITEAAVIGYFTDAYGNATNMAAATTITTAIPPFISGVQVVPGADATSVQVQWITDEPASSQVQYGETQEYGLTASSDG